MAEPAEKLRRAWFQIHLSTAVVLMFVAGGVMWMNLRPRAAGLQDDPAMGWPEWLRDRAWGWPAVVKQTTRSIFVFNESGFNTYSDETIWSTRNAIIDILCALAILIATAFVCEWLIRRREARAP